MLPSRTQRSRRFQAAIALVTLVVASLAVVPQARAPLLWNQNP